MSALQALFCNLLTPTSYNKKYLCDNAQLAVGEIGAGNMFENENF